MAQRVLVVDDQERDRRLVEAMLEPFGYAILTATSGDEALAIALSDPPDLILLDVVMPGMSGYDVCRQIRANERTQALPIVMLTANADQDKVTALEIGADDFLAKPVDRHELLARVRSLLRIKTYHDTITRQSAELAELNRTLERRIATHVGQDLAMRGLEGSALFRKEGDYWTIVFEGSAFRLRDGTGLRYLATLLAQPGRERHALDLAGSASGEGGRRQLGGDAGPVLDSTAKAQYHARLVELDEELLEAEQRDDRERIARADEERALLLEQLAFAVGLGGRDRKAASNAERARVSVTRAIRRVLDRIADQNPALGAHLTATLRTGQYCVYVPDPRSAIRWEL